MNPFVQAMLEALPRVNFGAMPPRAAPATDSRLKKPDTWPSFMAWPPGGLQAAFDRASEDKQKQILEQLDQWSEEMQRRAKAARTWLLERGINEPAADLEFGGVQFASMIAPGGIPPTLAQIVAKWGFNTLVTQDGGELRAHQGQVDIRRGTPQAIQALVIEARKRGWSSIEVQGSPQFCRQVANEAAKYGLPVQTRRMGRVQVISTGQPDLEAALAAPEPRPPSGNAAPKPPEPPKPPQPPQPPQPEPPKPPELRPEDLADGKVVDLSKRRQLRDPQPEPPSPSPTPLGVA